MLKNLIKTEEERRKGNFEMVVKKRKEIQKYNEIYIFISSSSYEFHVGFECHKIHQDILVIILKCQRKQSYKCDR